MATPVEPPWRCSVCGGVTPPDPLKTQFDPRFAEGYCATGCHHRRQLVRANSVAEATAGWHQLQAERERQKAERDKRDGRNQR